MTNGLTDVPAEADAAVEVQMYWRMLRIRRFEEVAVDLRKAGEIDGALHPYIGQEGVAVGVCANLLPEDRITSTHRGHGHALAKGARPDRMYAELFGTANGYCRGKGGSMHIADFGLGMLGANGIVGAGIGIAAGSALADHLTGRPVVTVAFFSDGAAGAGIFHESLNISALWQLPVIWMCENNGWADRTRTDEVLAAPNIWSLASPHGIPGEQVDGNDVFAVHEVAGRAIARARDGGGPTLIEATTFRMGPHSQRARPMPDIRDPETLERGREREPLRRCRAALLERGLLDEAIDAAIGEAVEREIAAAVQYARDSPPPELSSAYDDVYAGDIQ